MSNIEAAYLDQGAGMYMYLWLFDNLVSILMCRNLAGTRAYLSVQTLAG
jgi:hypothetical protein